MIEIRKGGTLRTTWEELRASIKNNTSSLNIGDEIDIVLKTGEKVTLVCERAGHRSATFFTKKPARRCPLHECELGCRKWRAVEHNGGISWQTVSFVARRIAGNYNRTTSVAARERGFWRKRIRKGRSV